MPTIVITQVDGADQALLQFQGYEVDLPSSGGQWQVVQDEASGEWSVVDQRGRSKSVNSLIRLKRARRTLRHFRLLVFRVKIPTKRPPTIPEAFPSPPNPPQSSPQPSSQLLSIALECSLLPPFGPLLAPFGPQKPLLRVTSLSGPSSSLKPRMDETATTKSAAAPPKSSGEAPAKASVKEVEMAAAPPLKPEPASDAPTKAPPAKAPEPADPKATPEAKATTSNGGPESVAKAASGPSESKAKAGMPKTSTYVAPPAPKNG